MIGLCHTPTLHSNATVAMCMTCNNPIIFSHFDSCAANGRDRVIDVKNAKLEEIEEQAQRLRNASGRKVLKLKSRQVSSRPSIQGPWRPGVAL